MVTKEKKTADELAALIMGEIRKYPECNHILNVTITRPVQRAPHQPNWDVAFVVHGNVIAPEFAYRIAREVQSHFDLA